MLINAHARAGPNHIRVCHHPGRILCGTSGLAHAHRDHPDVSHYPESHRSASSLPHPSTARHSLADSSPAPPTNSRDASGEFEPASLCSKSASESVFDRALLHSSESPLLALDGSCSPLEMPSRPKAARPSTGTFGATHPTSPRSRQEPGKGSPSPMGRRRAKSEGPPAWCVALVGCAAGTTSGRPDERKPATAFKASGVGECAPAHRSFSTRSPRL
jgi:hypothetical protein